MFIFPILLLISVVLNILLYHKTKNWRYDFQEELVENDFSDGDKVNVCLKREKELMEVHVKSTGLNFSVTHIIPEESGEVGEQTTNNKGGGLLNRLKNLFWCFKGVKQLWELY